MCFGIRVAISGPSHVSFLCRPVVRKGPMTSEELAEAIGQNDGEHGGLSTRYSQHGGLHRRH